MADVENTNKRIIVTAEIDCPEATADKIMKDAKNSPATIFNFCNYTDVGLCSLTANVKEEAQPQPEPEQPQIEENDPDVIDGEAKEVEEDETPTE